MIIKLKINTPMGTISVIPVGYKKKDKNILTMYRYCDCYLEGQNTPLVIENSCMKYYQYVSL